MDRERPRVLFITFDGLLEPLGQSQILPYLTGLAARGAAITVLSFEKPADWRSERMGALRGEMAARGVRWTALRYHARPRLVASAFDVLAGAAVAWRLIRRDRLAIVHPRSYLAAAIAWLLKRRFGSRLVFDTKGFWVDERVQAGFWVPGSLPYRLAKRVEQRLLEDADEIVTLTERGRRMIEQWPGLREPRVTAVPTCVDLARFAGPGRATAPNGAPVFIYIGSIGRYYLLDEMLRFVECSRRRFPQARFVLVTRQQEEAADALGRTALGAGAVTVASAPYPEIPQWVAGSHAGLAFYKPGGFRRGTCPTKLGEYLAMGVPVVVNAGIGDVEEVIGGSAVGAIVTDFSVEAYERALEELRRLWADPALAERCRRVAERAFSLQMGIERYWAIYARLAALSNITVTQGSGSCHGPAPRPSSPRRTLPAPSAAGGVGRPGPCHPLPSGFSTKQRLAAKGSA